MNKPKQQGTSWERRPATLEDLGGVAIGWCKAHDSVVDEGDDCLREGLKSDYPEYDDGHGGCVIVDAFLLPLPQMVAE